MRRSRLKNKSAIRLKSLISKSSKYLGTQGVYQSQSADKILCSCTVLLRLKARALEKISPSLPVRVVRSVPAEKALTADGYGSTLVTHKVEKQATTRSTKARRSGGARSLVRKYKAHGLIHINAIGFSVISDKPGLTCRTAICRQYPAKQYEDEAQNHAMM